MLNTDFRAVILFLSIDCPTPVLCWLVVEGCISSILSSTTRTVKIDLYYISLTSIGLLYINSVANIISAEVK